jgi:hypothetical protein
VWDDYGALPSLHAFDADLIVLVFHSVDGVCDEVERAMARTGLSCEQVCGESRMRIALEAAMAKHVSTAFALDAAAIGERLTVRHRPLRVELSAKGWSAQQRATIEAAAAWCFASLGGCAHMEVHPNFRTVMHPGLTQCSDPSVAIRAHCPLTACPSSMHCR